MNNQTTAVATVADAMERKVEFVPIGGTGPITLSLSIVKRYFTQKTKQGYEANEAECMKFVMLCKARALNPWEGDAYLQGYDSQDGPKFSLITAHQAFLKRAELNRNFNGMESGVVVLDADDQVQQYEGDLVLPGHELIGGWAKVHVKDRPRPYYKRLKLETFNTGRSRWQKDPAGMIVKCAEADGLRTAYPTSLGGLYSGEEQETVINVESVEPKQVTDAPAPKLPGQRRKQDTISMPETKPEPQDNGEAVTDVAEIEQPAAVQPAKTKPPAIIGVVTAPAEPADAEVQMSPLGKLKALMERDGLTYEFIQSKMAALEAYPDTERPIEALLPKEHNIIIANWRTIFRVWKARKVE